MQTGAGAAALPDHLPGPTQAGSLMVGTCLGESAQGEGGLRSRGTCQATAPVATDLWGDLRPSPTFPTPQSLPVSGEGGVTQAPPHPYLHP